MNPDDPQTRLARLLEERILVFDGAWGTMIQAYALGEADYRGERFRDHPRDLRGNHDVLVLTQRSVVEDIHRAYLAAGADIIETNTFSANRVSQADYAMEPYVYESGEVYGVPERPAPVIRSRVQMTAEPQTSRQRLIRAAREAAARRRDREHYDPQWSQRSRESQRMLLRQDAADARDLARRKDER